MTFGRGLSGEDGKKKKTNTRERESRSRRTSFACNSVSVSRFATPLRTGKKIIIIIIIRIYVRITTSVTTMCDERRNRKKRMTPAAASGDRFERKRHPRAKKKTRG